MKKLKFTLKKRWFLLFITIGLLLADSFYFALHRFDVAVEHIRFNKVNDDLHGLRIVFISDLHFGFSMNQASLQTVVDWINRLDADVILFGGDLFDLPSSNIPDETTRAIVSSAFQSMNANIAKLAVLGNHDHASPFTAALVTEVLQNGGFEVLVNRMHRIVVHQSSLAIVGIDSSLLGKPNIERALAFINADDLVVVLTHTPDLITHLPSNTVDWQLSGHSHGGQIALPWIGPLFTPPHARRYTHGTHFVNGTRLDITNGLGTSFIPVRFLTQPTIHLFILTAS